VEEGLAHRALPCPICGRERQAGLVVYGMTSGKEGGGGISATMGTRQWWTRSHSRSRDSGDLLKMHGMRLRRCSAASSLADEEFGSVMLDGNPPSHPPIFSRSQPQGGAAVASPCTFICRVFSLAV
jgi:hypothetical protein